MAISEKTRKNLWAKSGNRCSICKTELFPDSKGDNEFNIGEECHIISSKVKGPRHKEGLKSYDHLDNLILLCRNHHKEVDDLPETYTEEILRFIRANHENWVKETLDEALKKDSPKPRFLKLITSGKELFEIVSGSYGYRTDYDDVHNEEEAEYIGGVLQSIIDYGEI
ncbi:MAG: HNH endonuclease, partial [Cyclobacteriaceae bacterium]